MDDELGFSQYHPDHGPKKRLADAAAHKPDVTVDKPIRMRVQTRPGTMKHHYPRKAPRRRRNEPDIRNPTYY